MAVEVPPVGRGTAARRRNPNRDPGYYVQNSPTFAAGVRCPTPEWKYLASEDEVRSFLEKQCHLSRRTPVPGNEAEQHHDAFNVWGRWVEDGTIIAPFCVVHVDAHSDLGSGWSNRSFTFIETELLALPSEQRRHPAFAPEHLNSGNYLLGAIANRWISQLTYVYPIDRTESEPAQPGTLPRFDDQVREMTRLLWAEQGASGQ